MKARVGHGVDRVADHPDGFLVEIYEHHYYESHDEAVKEQPPQVEKKAQPKYVEGGVPIKQWLAVAEGNGIAKMDPVQPVTARGETDEGAGNECEQQKDAVEVAVNLRPLLVGKEPAAHQDDALGQWPPRQPPVPPQPGEKNRAYHNPKTQTNAQYLGENRCLPDGLVPEVISENTQYL